jgi:hypothetical protein
LQRLGPCDMQHLQNLESCTECRTHHPTLVDTLQVTDQSQLGLGKVELHANHNPNKQMLGAEWTGKQSITVNRRDVPVVTDPVICCFIAPLISRMHGAAMGSRHRHIYHQVTVWN